MKFIKDDHILQKMSGMKERNLFILLRILLYIMAQFDIQKMQRLLEERAKMGFGGWTVCITESEMVQIIAELEKARGGQ